jgi:hypothetical protein
LLLVALLATAGGLVPAKFAARPGWHVGHDRVRACPGARLSSCSQVESWAATTRWRDCGTCNPPKKTLAALTPDGIAIYLSLNRKPNSPEPKRLAWPPRLRSGDVKGSIEGVPKRIGYIAKFGQVRTSVAYVYVFFGRRHPTASQLGRAKAELRTAKIK